MNGLLFPVAAVVAAELFARTLGIESGSLAAPSDIAIAGWHAFLDGSLLSQTLETLHSTAIGLLIGGGLGLIASILVGLFSPIARLSYVTIEILRPIPSVALIPIALLVFGLGLSMEVSIIAFACFWPLLIMGQAAIRGINPRLIEVASALRFGLLHRTIKIVLPAVLPQLFVAARLATGLALILAITVEITANPLGLGHGLMVAQRSMRPDLMFATLIWLGIIGWGLNQSLLVAQEVLFGRFSKSEPL